MKKFTTEEDQFLRDNYLTIPASRMSKILGRDKSAAHQRMARLGLVVPPDVTQRFSEESRIKPGSISHNKGKRQSEFMSPESIERTRATRFGKGHLPHNTKTDLEISIRTDKRGVKYKYIRVALAKWVPLHRYNWEQANGEIPPNMNLIFLDGDTMNCSLENLQLLSNKELMLRNTVHNLPKPLAQTVQLRGALNRQINKHIKKLNDEK